MIMTDDILKWIEENKGEDPVKLRLRYHKHMTSEIDFAIMQIECRKKAAKKLSKTLENKHFIFPTTLSAEQCTSDLLASFHASLIEDGQNVIDLTSGLGIDVFNLARKASHVTAIEINQIVADAIPLNATQLGLNNISVINADCKEFLINCDEKFDVAFIDPARRGDGGKRLYALSQCSPDVTEILPLIKSHCQRLIVKASPMLDISQTLKELPNCCDIYLIGTPQECKEIVAVIEFDQTESIPNIHAVTLGKETISHYIFNREQEANAIASYSIPQEQHYLYEPYPATMKAAPVKLLSEQYKVNKLHPATHLYTSSTIINNLPAESFKIEKIIPFSSKEIKQFAKSYPQINVATRNFPLSADELRKKLKVCDGGNKRAMATTLANGEKVILILSRIE